MKQNLYNSFHEFCSIQLPHLCSGLYQSENTQTIFCKVNWLSTNDLNGIISWCKKHSCLYHVQGAADFNVEVSIYKYEGTL